VRLVKLAAESGHSEGVVSLLRSFEDTNELAVAVLAGSSARIHKLLSKGELAVGDLMDIEYFGS